MACVEEVINLPILLDRFRNVISLGRLANVMDEIVNQSRVEFNFTDDDNADSESGE